MRKCFDLNGPWMLLFRNHALGFWFSGWKKSFGLYSWQPNKRQRAPCFVLYRESHFLLSGQALPKGAAQSLRGETGVLILCCCASLVIGGVVCRLLFFEEASTFRKNCFTVQHTLLNCGILAATALLTSRGAVIDNGMGGEESECTSPDITFLNTALPPFHGFDRPQYFSADLRGPAPETRQLQSHIWTHFPEVNDFLTRPRFLISPSKSILIWTVFKYWTWMRWRLTLF